MSYFAATLERVTPPWMQRTVSGKVMFAFADVLDELEATTSAGVKARFPSANRPDDLPVIGRERRIVRGYNEPAVTYAKRLVRWWDDHSRRGGAYALLRQLEAFWSTSPRQVDLVYASGTRYVLGSDGSITRDFIASNADPARWARASLFYYLTEDELPIGYSFAESLMVIPREWNAAHMLDLNVFGLSGGCRVWGYPPEPWGEPEPWGCAIRINDLYPSGAPPANTLTIGGLPVTIDLDEVTVTL